MLIEKAIYLVRHGNTASNNRKIYAGRRNERLSQDGVSQVKSLGKQMKGLDIPLIYTSPIRRAVQTARLLNRYLGGKIIIEPDLTEMDMGPWEGLSEEEVATRYPSEYRLWQKKPSALSIEGREFLQDLQERALRALNRVLERNYEGSALMVTHVAVMRTLLLHFRNLSLDRYKSIVIPNAWPFKGIYRNGRFQIERMN